MGKIRKKKLFDYAVQATHAINKLQIGADELRKVVVVQNKHIDELQEKINQAFVALREQNKNIDSLHFSVSSIGGRITNAEQLLKYDAKTKKEKKA
ncbi:hypothetical protein UFOVP1138_59 [uncultured Caudovirales phage]|uniref:Uncharacterized protein n=1 Tax=uncultured Caudovirales phage TaxID=2100421 RepID=A0A6J5QUN8_9CAUD|nr:hypothetical protein UFOVP975_61 [uncultured Caudovirales phage]CAB4186287.1 hypothetical protein UFOVP1138_59 [uncultured Caudovirales phage]CAB4204436.1 hypothetical protein UFOVP1394_56 [uncultured Caudovirales phage]